jgi:hypothetical protein
MINRTLEYVDKISKDAEYDNKLSDAVGIKKSIRAAARGENKDTNLKDAAKQFLGIDPLYVKNIEQFIQKGNELKEALIGSRGGKLASTVNIAELNKYSEEQRIAKEEKILENLREEIQDITGIDTSDMSYEELMEVPEKKLNKIKDETGLKLRAKNVFDSLVGVTNRILETGIDPITGEEFDIDPESKRIIKDYIDIMNVDRMDLNDINKSIDAINNFLVNKSVARLEAVAKTEKGKFNAERDKNMLKKQEKENKFKFKELKGSNRAVVSNIATLPMTFDIFFGKKRALHIQESMGLEDIREGANKAMIKSKKIAGDYAEKFSKQKPNGKKFMSEENIIERGVVADLMRSTPGRENEDFARKVNDLEHTIDVLEQGDEQNQKDAKVLAKVKDKLFKGIDNPKKATIDDVLKNTAPENIKAIEYAIGKFGEDFDLFAKTSEAVYNKKLARDKNYTPRKIKTIKEEPKELGTDESMIDRRSNSFYQKEAGILMKATNRPLSEEQYVDYNFDQNFIDRLEDGLVDAYTAGPIKQINGYVNSDAFKSIFPKKDMRNLIKDKLDNTIRIYRNKTYADPSEMKYIVKKMNALAGIGTKAGLISVSQFLKQLTPFLNTMINAGPLNALRQLDMLANIDKLNFINNSNMDVALRGQETLVHIEEANDMLRKAAESTGDIAMHYINKAGDVYMKAFLTAPDAFAAKTAWMAYYEKYLKEHGLYKTVKTRTTDSGQVTVETEGIDYKTHKMNKDAARYAQKELDRQQNVSFKALQGKMFTSKKAAITFIRQTLFPLANFRMNQYIRMRDDWKTVFEKTSTGQEKMNALRSLAALKAEIIMYKAIGAAFSILFGSVANILRGKEETDDEFTDRVKKVLMGQVGSAVVEYISPIPLLDFFIQGGIYLSLDKSQELADVKEDDRINIYAPGHDNGEGLTGAAKDLFNSLGALGMTASKSLDVVNAIFTGMSDKVKDKYGNEKVLTDDDRNTIRAVTPLILMSNLLLLPNDFSNVGNKIVNGVVRDAKTQSKIDKEQKHFERYGAYDLGNESSNPYNVDPYK